MAMSIRPTPTLSGKDAERFLANVTADQGNKIDFSSEIERAKKILEKSKKAQTQG